MLRETATLEGKALDWAVNDCLQPDEEGREFYRNLPCFVECRPYSTDWSLAGPIIEREMLHISPRFLSAGYERPKGSWVWQAYVLGSNNVDDNFEMEGSTPVLAAMRCFVASKRGETVDIPDELI